MKFKFTLILLFILSFTSAAKTTFAAQQNVTILEEPAAEQSVTETLAEEVLKNLQPTAQKKHVRGIHLSAFISGPEKHRKAVIELFNSTELNTAVIDIKEIDGKIYIDGVETADANGAYFRAIPNAAQYIQKLKENGVYTVARVVAFRDNTMARKKPSMAVKNPDGSLWTDRKNITWLDPYNKEARDYILEVSTRAAQMGFDEIQFDYIRFPSDGNIKNCRYSNPDHSAAAASKAIVDFLKEAARVLHEQGVKVSIDVFGATTTSDGDMGIGQKIVEMTEHIDYVSPMIYPSHYYKGDLGVANPNKSPYTIVYLAVKSALKTKKIPPEKFRPWLQDFSLYGVRYGAKEVRAQIQACYDNEIGDWLLWNPACAYTRSALEPNEAEDYYDKNDTDEIQNLMIAETGKNFLKMPIVSSSSTTALAQEQIITELEIPDEE
ncbi:putative glycoside hydrolase [Endomicrobium proavitum]|uniref:DUF4015 domain-containing protein n=1 Tax=Endomicrobium proavitum TaxID=1408281 RepID=A0A0G3WL69_9BACT|nr:putative glycoside hydrolase [Endomicrobium proavitum]AKL98607.1 conserved exported protein of unknown function [Endomicrobium proavitum]